MHKQASCVQRGMQGLLSLDRVLSWSPQPGDWPSHSDSAVMSHGSALELPPQSSKQLLPGEQVSVTLSFISNFAAGQSLRPMESRIKHVSNECV